MATSADLLLAETVRTSTFQLALSSMVSDLGVLVNRQISKLAFKASRILIEVSGNHGVQFLQRKSILSNASMSQNKYKLVISGWFERLRPETAKQR